MTTIKLIIISTLLHTSTSFADDICESDEECFMSKTIKNAFLYSVSTRKAKPLIDVDYSYKNADGLIMALVDRNSDYAREELVSLSDYYFGDRYEDVLNIMIKHQSKSILPFLERALKEESKCSPQDSRFCRSKESRIKYLNKLIASVKS